jgi:hypothetical protein
VVIFLRFGRESLGAPARAKRIGELIDGENTPSIQSRSFLISQTGEEAKIVLFDRSLPAVVSKLALRAMSV